MEQARNALKYCLSHLNAQDRFSVISFSTNVRKFRDNLMEANGEYIEAAKKWVDGLKAGGGTAIQAALDSALEMRSKDEGRSSMIVFFTDGQPSIGEMKPEKILKSVTSKTSAGTRIFTFGVGDDVNTALLDQLSENTRAISTYVRPEEDIQTKVAGLYGKISHPVLANVRFSASSNINLHDVYPITMPDLFYGSQMVILGRFSGDGAASVKLVGNVGKDTREYVYDVTFPAKTNEDRDFVENLWARRKVGFLLDQIRLNGEQKELLDELLVLSKKYGIATPYTSFLVVPDVPLPVVEHKLNHLHSSRPEKAPVPPGLLQYAPQGTGSRGAGQGGGIGGPLPVLDFARLVQTNPADQAKSRSSIEENRLNDDIKKMKLDSKTNGAQVEKDELTRRLEQAQSNVRSYNQARLWLNQRNLRQVQAGNAAAVDLAICSNNLRTQERLSQTANRIVFGRNCLEIGGVWIDDAFCGESKTLVVKAQSDAYFAILAQQPRMKEVFRLGNHLVFVTPSKVALVIDASSGLSTLQDNAIKELFTVAK